MRFYNQSKLPESVSELKQLRYFGSQSQNLVVRLFLLGVIASCCKNSSVPLPGVNLYCQWIQEIKVSKIEEKDMPTDEENAGVFFPKQKTTYIF
jgi:hypothetical protein